MFTFTMITHAYIDRAAQEAIEELLSRLQRPSVDIIRVTIVQTKDVFRKVTITFNL